MKEKMWKHRRQQKVFSRDQRKDQIMGQFGIWQLNEDTEPKTMNRIAKALGMQPSQKVTDMLLELCAEGKLTFVIREKSGRWTARGFTLVGGADIITRNSKRRIVVKQRGVVVDNLSVLAGQMGLWS